MAVDMDWIDENKSKGEADRNRQYESSSDSDSDSESEEEEECKVNEAETGDTITRIPRRILMPFFIEQWVDARDQHGRWYEAQIKQLRFQPPNGLPVSPSNIQNNDVDSTQNNDIVVEQVYVHFKGFNSKHDEWVDATIEQTSPDVRVAPLHSHTTSVINHARVSYTINCLIDCLDSLEKWYRAVIVDISHTRGQVLVHYENFNPRFDEWINVESGRIQPRGTRIVPVITGPYEPPIIQSYNQPIIQSYNRPINQSIKSSSALYRTSKRCPVASADHESAFRDELLRSLNLVVLDQGGEGNCLFRSMSHQLYGTSDHHEMIRNYCMDYIEAEANFFQSFINEDLADYVARKRQLGEWGDHVEIQAMSEIYNASIEVYAYSIQPLATFHRRQSRIIRLSYHGNSHYNSLVDRNALPPLIHELPGVVETRVLAQLNMTRPRDDELTRALQASRSDFLASSSFEDAVAESLRTLAEQDARQLADAAAQSERDEIEQKQMELAIAEEQREFEQRELIQAVEQSRADLPAAIELDDSSMNQSNNQSDNRSNIQSNNQPSSSYDEQLSHALAESAAESEDFVDSSIPRAVQEVVALGFPLESAVAAYTMFNGSPMDHQMLIDSMIEVILASK